MCLKLTIGGAWCAATDKLSFTRLKEIATTVKWLTAQEANWNLERRAFNLLVDQQPAGIALPPSMDDVSDVVRSAAADGKRVAAPAPERSRPQRRGRSRAGSRVRQRPTTESTTGRLSTVPRPGSPSRPATR